jgi:hypothetical protein
VSGPAAAPRRKQASTWGHSDPSEQNPTGTRRYNVRDRPYRKLSYFRTAYSSGGLDGRVAIEPKDRVGEQVGAELLL